MPFPTSTDADPAAPRGDELAAVTRQHAELYLAGCYGDVLPGSARCVHADARVEVWLVGWAPGEWTGLHDRGAAAGAFTVADGTLLERVPVGWSDGWMSLRDIRRGAGATATFTRHHIHDLGTEPGAVPAVSVHAYSPPLPSVRRYEVAGGELVALRAETSDVSDASDTETLRWAS